MSQLCPCGSGQSLDQCCGPHIEGASWPQNAESLMRSWYSAYVLGRHQWLVETTHPDYRENVDADKLAEQTRDITWLRLDIAATENDVPAGEHGELFDVVEFYAYSCGYCHRLFPELQTVMANNGDVKFAFKPLTFVSPISEYAARAALAANKQGKFIEMHNAMFEFGGQLTEAAIDEIAGKQGLDMEKYKADLNSQAVSDELAAVSELANKIQINGVPALVVNGKMVQTLDGSVIQDALNK